MLNSFRVLVFGAVIATQIQTPAVPQAAGAVALPIDWTLTPDRIESTCMAEVNRAAARIDALAVTRPPLTFERVVLPLENAFADLDDNTVAQRFLDEVSSDRPTRMASNHCNQAENKLFALTSARPEIVRELVAAKTPNIARNPAKSKLLDLWLTVFKRAGAELPSAQRGEFVRLSTQIDQLESKYNQNLRDDDSSIAVTAGEVADLPATFTASFTPTSTGYIVPVNLDTHVAFMNNVASEAARKRYYLAWNRRGGSANVAILEQTLMARAALAKLLGYRSWAAYQLADRMAATPERVQRFLDHLDADVLPRARAEMAALARLKGSGTFYPWDEAFYQKRLRIARFNVNQSEIQNYFPAPHTIDAVLAIYERLFGVKITQLSPASAYDPDLLEYTVDDPATGRHIGNFNLDLYPRSGKFGYFANFQLVGHRILADGSERAPLSIIVGNWPRESNDKVALLTQDEVRVFFHEFGHCMAAMLADTPYSSLSIGFRQDFIEAPAEMLENWVWDPTILKELSSNVTTGEPLPDDLIRQMIAARHFDEALDTTKQILFARVDLLYHDSGPAVDTTQVWKNAIQTLTPEQFVDGTYPQANFMHIMSGYDAGYYGYLWSQVYAQDMFRPFSAAGLQNPDIGARYRAIILAPARSIEPDKAVARFLGRPMSTAAFYADLGMTPESTPTR